MKIYYTASTEFKESDETSNVFQKTLNYITFKVGKKNVKSWKQTPELTKNDQSKMGEVVKAVKLNEKSIRDCDAMVIDITKGSSGVGFQIALGMNEKKATLVMRNKKDARRTRFDSTTANFHKNVVYREYDSTEEITGIIDEFIEDAKQKIDTKFILIIPAEIDKYLNWASDFRRMHKAQVVRQAVEKEMSKDKDWKTYLKNDEL